MCLFSYSSFFSFFRLTLGEETIFVSPLLFSFRALFSLSFWKFLSGLRSPLKTLFSCRSMTKLTDRKMKVAVIGSGVSGLVSAYVLAEQGVEVVLYEKKEYLGGHARTVTYDGVDLDLGFMVFNHVTHPQITEFFENLGVDMDTCDMSFSVSLDKGRGCEWGTRNGLSSLFAAKRNLFNPYFWKMLREITMFKHDMIIYLEVLESNPDIDRNETLGKFIQSHHYSELFLKAYLIPVCTSILHCPSEGVMSFSAFSVLSVCRNHYLLQLFGSTQWLTVKWGSDCYVKKVKEVLESKGCQIRTGSEVHKVSTTAEAIQACDAVRILGEQATSDERRILGAFPYVYCDVFLHCDKTLMPQNQAAWSALNYLESTDNKVCLTYWFNQLQNLKGTSQPYLVTLNPDHTPDHTLLKWSTSHPVPSIAASKSLLELHRIQGNRGIWFCEAYQGYGFHEDGLKAGIAAAHGMLGKGFSLLGNHKHMALSLTETVARQFITRFLKRYISTGCLILLEEGGTMLTFKGNRKDCSLKSVLKVHSPQFYWKVMTQADLGIADAYINGDFSFSDKNRGLLNFFMLLIANGDSSASKSNKKRGWWQPLFFTATIASAKYFFQHFLRPNSLTQARRNISRHYDLSNELFSLFLDETMMYSTAVFKTEDEDLKVAQHRKISVLIEKARISENHEVLDIGCGWGTLAIEAVKQTGCRYTGITLSEEQLKFAEKKVKDAGLQDRIKILLCDYRQLPSNHKYDRILSCEMLEHVGHEFVDEFFSCCDSLLAENGILVLQFTSIPDERYDDYRRSSDFIKEYIFPGGCLPSLSRVTSAMAASSRLCVEHLENIGIHYYQTLRHWRKNFLERQSEILALGFNENFIRTWEYYFDYCAAGFKSHTLGDYQIVFSRPGNALTFNNPYKGFPSAY